MKAASRFAGDELDSQSGQASVFLLLILGTFLLASVGFAVDLSSMWFHRQAAQSAADAACVAGAMDMLYLQKGTITSSPGFTVGTAGDCYSSSSAALCKYAAFNGYTATTSAAGWGASTPGGAVAVNWTFPSSVTGVIATSGVTYPFLNVVVQEKPNTWFMGMLGVKVAARGSILYLRTSTWNSVRAPGHSQPHHQFIPYPFRWRSYCDRGRPDHKHPGEFLGQWLAFIQCFEQCRVLQWWQRLSHRYQYRGPQGGGGNVAVVGGPTTNQLCGANYIMNNTTHAQWKSPSAVASDPYASVPAPTQPAAKVAEATTPIATVAQGYTPALIQPMAIRQGLGLRAEQTVAPTPRRSSITSPTVRLIPITAAISTAIAWNLLRVIIPAGSTPPASQAMPTMWSCSCPAFTI